MRSTDRFASTAALAAMLALLSGCGTTGRSASVPDGELFACDTDQARLFDRLEIMEQLATQEAPSLDLLLLSGGGAHGAWGAGFLKGWSERVTADGGTLEFDLVTGVSTGALQATHAFLGDYDTLYEIYTTITNREVWRKRSWLAVPFSNSLLKSKPLSEYIDGLITPTLIARVADAGQRRLLCVGSVELRTGQFRKWDLTAVARAHVDAAGQPERQQQLENLYQAILLGSAAIPVAFPPVEIRDEVGASLYVDGGTRQNVFISFGDIAELSATPMALAGEAGDAAGVPAGDPMPVNIYAIINGQLGIAPAAVDDKLVPIAKRSLDAVLAQSLNGAIYQIYWELDRREAGSEHVTTHYSYIPADACPGFTTLDFDPVAMQDLADKASDFGRALEWFEFQPDAVVEACDERSLAY